MNPHERFFIVYVVMTVAAFVIGLIVSHFT